MSEIMTTSPSLLCAKAKATSSSAASAMALTPAAVRPMTDTSSTAKWMAMPWRLSSSTPSQPSGRSTSSSLSPFFRFSAAKRDLRTLYSESAVRLMRPLRVANINSPDQSPASTSATRRSSFSRPTSTPPSGRPRSLARAASAIFSAGRM